MEIRTLRYFLAVVDEGNLTRAAEALSLTQSALSRQMSMLERELGTTLFTRGQRIELTEAGELLAARARETVGSLDSIADDVRSLAGLRGEVSLGMGELAASRSLVEAACSLRRAHPLVSVSLRTDCAAGLRRGLDDGSLDFALLLEPVDAGAYEYVRMAERERWGLLVRADDPLASRPAATSSDLAGTPLAVPDRAPLTAELASWAGQPLEEADVAMTFNVVDHAARAVLDGGLRAVTLEGSAALFDPAALAFVPLGPELSATSILAWRKRRALPRAAAAFLQAARHMSASHGEA